jgi:hypothetical protein
MAKAALTWLRSAAQAIGPIAAGAVGGVLIVVVVFTYLVDPSEFAQWASAEAAIAVALLTSLLLSANFDLVAATQKLAKASADQTTVLLASAQPELKAEWYIPQGVAPIQAKVRYVSGTLPARQVRVRGRLAGLLYVGSADIITATDSARAVVMQQVAHADNWPFDVNAPNLGPNQNWIGVTWRGHEGAERSVRWKDEPLDGYVSIAN